MIPRSILVAEDLENFSEIGRRRGKTVRGVAQEMSRLLREDVRLFYVEDTKTYPQKKIHNQQDVSSWHHTHEEILRKLAKEVSAKTQFTIQTGSATDEILKAVHAWPRPEMVIMGTQGHTGIERFLEGSVAENVLLKSERPVMVIGPRAQQNAFKISDHRPLKIMVATDLTRASRPAEQYALSLAARIGAGLTLFHSTFDKVKRIHEASITSGFANFDMERIYQKMNSDAKIMLDFKRNHMRKVVSNCESIIAAPQFHLNESLLKELTKNHCLLVMGTHSKRNALVRAFLGSSARDMILQAEVPVVIVHPH